MNDSMAVKIGKNTTKIENLEDNVSELWKKWDSMQKLVIGTLISASLSFIGVIILLLKTIK